jgi:hypothetical protein
LHFRPLERCPYYIHHINARHNPSVKYQLVIRSASGYPFTAHILPHTNEQHRRPTTLKMSSQISSPPQTQKRARRLSKFVEGSPATGAELLQQTPTSNELFLNILSEMDEFEKKRQHPGSSSSVDSLLLLSNGSPGKDRRKSSEREERRGTGGGRPSLDAVREVVEEKKGKRIVGRLRALTGGREREGKGAVYPGT